MGQKGTLLVWGLEYVNSSYVFFRNGSERKYVSRHVHTKDNIDLMLWVKEKRGERRGDKFC